MSSSMDCEDSAVDTMCCEPQIRCPVETLTVIQSVDKTIAYPCDTLTYHIALRNTNLSCKNDVTVHVPLAEGMCYVSGSFTANVAVLGDPITGITLCEEILPGQTVAMSFEAVVEAMPNPNPIAQIITASFTYMPCGPLGCVLEGCAFSNPVKTVVFRHDFSQEITDLIESVALEQAALAAIANEEGAKIQRAVAMPCMNICELLCINKSVTRTIDSITMLEHMMRRKLNHVACQISPCDYLLFDC